MTTKEQLLLLLFCLSRLLRGGKNMEKKSEFEERRLENMLSLESRLFSKRDNGTSGFKGGCDE